MSPQLLIEVTFSLNGKLVKFKMSIEELNAAIELLEFLNESLVTIKGIPDISHLDLYKHVFKSGVTHECTAQTREQLSQSLQRVVSDTAYIEELRRINVEKSKQFIFDGFFNKIIESFLGEYAIQFAQI